MRHFRRFCIYRDMGVGRSVRRAAEVNKLKKKGQHGAWRYWQQVAYLWQWAKRAKAFDEWQGDIRQKEADRLAAEAAIREAEEEEAWRQRQLRAHVSVQEAGIQVFARLLELVQQGKVKALPLEDVKQVEQSGGEGGSFDRHETLTRGISAWLPIALKALAEGQRMEALARGLPTDRTAVQIDEAGMIEKVVQAIERFVPADQQEVLAKELDDLLGLNGTPNGKPAA